jgi:hypothetical protein
VQADAVAATVNQRDANATWEAAAGEFGAVLSQYREMLSGNEDVTLFCAKRVIKRTWDQQYLNRVRSQNQRWLLQLQSMPLIVCSPV